MKTNKKKRILSIVTAIAVMFTMSSVSIFALDGAGEPADDQQQVQTQGDDQSVEAQLAATDPTTPTIDLTATPKNGEVALEWTLEGFDLAQNQYEYTITYGLVGGGYDNQIVKILGDQAVGSANGDYSCPIPSLENWKKYSFKISVSHRDDTTESETVEAIPSGQLTIANTVPGYRAIKVVWNAGPDTNLTGADFELTRNGAPVDVSGAVRDGDYLVFIDRNLASQYVALNYISDPPYDYQVKVKGNDSSASAVVRNYPIKRAYYSITTKMKKKLKSHNSGARITLAKGTRLNAVEYGSGKYRFYDGSGNLFYITRISTKKASATYANTRYNNDYYTYYTRDAAETFINTSGMGSNTNKLVWVSTFTQHAYFFQGSAGNWTLINDWKISTGKASTPSPTGAKKLTKKIKNRHGIKYWNCYSSLNALHGVKKNWGSKLGSMQSSGCIRNPNSAAAGAQWIYNNCGKGTRIWVY